MAITFPVLSHRFKWELPGNIHDSGFASFGRALLPWLGVNTNKALVRNFSLTLESTTESSANTIAAQWTSSDSGQSCPWWEESPWWTFSWGRRGLGRLKRNYIGSLHKPLGFKKVTPLVGSFFDLFDFDWFESWGTQHQSTLQTLGIILLIIITVISLVCHILSEALNACSQPLATSKWSP